MPSPAPTSDTSCESGGFQNHLQFQKFTRMTHRIQENSIFTMSFIVEKVYKSEPAKGEPCGVDLGLGESQMPKVSASLGTQCPLSPDVGQHAEHCQEAHLSPGVEL